MNTFAGDRAETDIGLIVEELKLICADLRSAGNAQIREQADVRPWVFVACAAGLGALAIHLLSEMES